MSKVKLPKLLLLLENALNFLCKGLVPNLLVVEEFGAFRSIVDNFCYLMWIKLDNGFMTLVQPYLRLVHILLTRFCQ